MSEQQILRPGATVYVAGHRGLVGSALWRALEAYPVELIGATSAELDLRDRDATFAFFDTQRPDVVIDAAARVGGIMANASAPVDFLSDNLRIQTNLMDAALAVRVPKLLFLGSSCIYPKLAPQPISEDALLTGPLEETNDAYAIAKIAGVIGVQAVRRQYGLAWVSAMPTNLYGPGDNFDPTTAHVLPALIRRFDEARRTEAEQVTMWGTGTPRREFLHTDDLATGVLRVLEAYDDPAPINIGVGEDVSIAELAALVAEVVGYTGAIEHDTGKPDGTPRKLLDVSRLRALGWAPSIGLRDGIEATYRWYLDNRAEGAESVAEGGHR